MVRRTEFVLLLALIITVSVACVIRTESYVVEVKRGATLEEKLAIANTVATEPRLARLKEQVKERLPGTTDAQLARMGLLLNEHHSGAGPTGTAVRIIVTIEEQGGVDGALVVKTAAAILEAEINGLNETTTNTAARRH